MYREVHGIIFSDPRNSSCEQCIHDYETVTKAVLNNCITELANVLTNRIFVFLTYKWGQSFPSALQTVQIASCAAVYSGLPSSSSGCSTKGQPSLRWDSLGLHSEGDSRTLCHFWIPVQTSNGTLHLECLVHAGPSSSGQFDCCCEAIPANTGTVIEVFIQSLY